MWQCGLERDTFHTIIGFHQVSSGSNCTNTDFSFEACPGMLRQETIRNSPADQNAPAAKTSTKLAVQILVVESYTNHICK